MGEEKDGIKVCDLYLKIFYINLIYIEVKEKQF